MQLALQHKLDALQRVQAFLDAHPDVGSALRDSAARHELDAAVAAVLEASHVQATAPLSMAAQLSRQNALTMVLKEQHMQPIAAFGRARLRGVPDFAALTRSSSKLSVNVVVRAARAMATAAAPHAAALTENGFPADEVAQLESLASAVESAYAERSRSRVAMVGATRNIMEHLQRGREAVQILNGVMSRMLAGNAGLQAEWNSAKRVTAKPGVARGSTTAATPLTTSASTQQAAQPEVTQAVQAA